MPSGQSQSDGGRVFSSYRSLFNIHYKIYNLGNVTLPFPIPMDGLAVFVVLLAPSLFLGRLLGGLLSMPDVAAGFLSDFGLTWLCLQADPQGRSLPVFLAEVGAFLVRPKKRAFGGGVLWLKREKVRWEIVDIG